MNDVGLDMSILLKQAPYMGGMLIAAGIIVYLYLKIYSPESEKKRAERREQRAHELEINQGDRAIAVAQASAATAVKESLQIVDSMQVGMRENIDRHESLIERHEVILGITDARRKRDPNDSE